MVTRSIFYQQGFPESEAYSTYGATNWPRRCLGSRGQCAASRSECGTLNHKIVNPEAYFTRCQDVFQAKLRMILTCLGSVTAVRIQYPPLSTAPKSAWFCILHAFRHSGGSNQTLEKAVGLRVIPPEVS